MATPTRRRTKRSKSNSKGHTASVVKRLQSELLELMNGCYEGVSAFPEPDNFLLWRGTIAGPESTVYEGLTFRVKILFPSTYPFRPPFVTFETPCFHPNVALEDGSICLDILKENWSAVYNVSSILISVQSLLGSPNNESPLNSMAASLWDDQSGYKRTLMSYYTKSEEG